jgi:hypothetical protein
MLVAVSLPTCAANVSVIGGAGEALMAQAVIANGTTKPAASHAASILPAFELATGLFPPMSILGLPGGASRILGQTSQV